MKSFLILAGLPQSVFEMVRGVSERRFVPHGHLVRSPMSDKMYTKDYAATLIRAVHSLVVR